MFGFGIIPTMDKLKQIIEQNDTPSGRIFDLAIQGLIVLSLITFSIETLPDLSDNATAWLRLITLSRGLWFFLWATNSMGVHHGWLRTSARCGVSTS